jgi:hypothetical protein
LLDTFAFALGFAVARFPFAGDALGGLPPLSGSKLKTSARYKYGLPPTSTYFNRPRFTNSLIEARDTPRNSAASACEIKSAGLKSSGIRAPKK